VSDHKRVFALILIMIAVSGGIGVAAVGLLYQAAFEEEQQRLIEISRSHARLIESMARFNETYSRDYPKGPREATLSQVRNAHVAYEGFGETGELTLAELQGNHIHFILSFRHGRPDAPKRILLQSNLAEPMRRALAGRSGTLIGLDYRGVKVLAAHEPVAVLDLGIVAKMDLAQIRAPFLRAGSLVGGTGLLLIGAGILVFFRVSKPMLQRIADSEERFRSISTTAQDAIIMLDDTGKVSFWNTAAEKIFGYEGSEACGKALTDLIIPERYRKRHQAGAENFLRTGHGLLVNKTVELEAERKDGTEIPVEISVSGLRWGRRWNAVGIIRDVTKRKEAEQAAQEKQRLLEQILENIPHSIFWKDRESIYLGCNRHFARHAGVKKAEYIIGKSDYDLAWREREADFFRKIDKKVMESAQPQLDIEEQQRQADGTQATLLTSKVPLSNSRGDVVGILGIYADITERKRAEQEIRAREEKLQLILASTGEGIFGIGTDGRCTFANRACARLLGYKNATELFGKNMHELIHHTRFDGTAYPAEKCPTFDACRSGKMTHVEAETLWRADGSHFAADYTSYPMLRGSDSIGAVVTFSDVTDRQRAEEALRERERQLKLILASTGEGIFGMDGKGRCTFANRASVELLRYQDEKDLLGQDMHVLIHHPRPDDTPHPEAKCPLHQALKQNKVVHLDDELLWRADGSSFSAECRSYPMLRDGEIVGTVVNFTDITERKEKEAQLRQAQKMEVVGQLTGGIAHDFNNLLTVILANLGLLGDEIGSDAGAKLQPLIDDAFSAAQDGAALTHRLLAFSRKQSLHVERVDIDEFLGNIWGFLKRTLREDIELRINRANEARPVLVDPAQFESAMLNLAVNARDAMPAGGTLSIETTLQHIGADEPTADLGLAPGTYVMITVRDSGTGMSPDDVARAIEPFFTTKPRGKGSGLGLSMVYGFAKQSGGTLLLRSALGEGTSVSMLLPKAPQAIEKDNAERNLRRAPAGSETILLVEDERQIRTVAKRILLGLGYRVMEVENSEAAMKVLESEAAVHLLFSDIVTPGAMNGRELARWALQNCHGLKVLLTTGFSSEATAELPDKDSGFDLLRKPYTREELAAAVRATLDGGT
jgi:PAS domain S-box-containing protein